MVTVLPAGIVEGAVYTVGEPLFVWVGLKEPQTEPLPHVADQSTPAFEESLETVAVTLATASTPIVVGGAAVMVTVTEWELEHAAHTSKGKSMADNWLMRSFQTIAALPACTWVRVPSSVELSFVHPNTSQFSCKLAFSFNPCVTFEAGEQTGTCNEFG